MKYRGQTEYLHDGPPPGAGVLLCNLGTPDEPRPAALRRYLDEFLSDPRVVEVPRLLWWMILHGIILRVRPARSAALYRKVWSEAGAPLLDISRRQQASLQASLDRRFGGGAVPVELGMRYGNPSIDSALRKLADQNVRSIVVVPLYPQYCAATVGSTFDSVAESLRRARWVPELHFISGYHRHEPWLEALANSVSEHVAEHGMPQKLLLSYHGTPQRYLEQGDPYHCFCHQTTRLLRERMGLDETQLLTTFQSRFGREPWLQPYTDETLQALPASGVTDVAVVCPGFSADCLETLEEIELQNRELFLAAGGTQFRYIPALNDRDDHIAALESLVLKYLPQA